MTELAKIASAFRIPPITSIEPYGNGHINQTYLVETEAGKGARYILQRVNTNVFRQPKELMANIQAVTKFLGEKIAKNGGDPDRETLTLIPLKETEAIYLETEDGFYRMYLFVEDSVCMDAVETPEQFETCGYAFGNFAQMLAEFPAETLYEVIPNFHNTQDRYRKFEEALAKDALGRAASVQEEIAFVRAHAHYAPMLQDAMKVGKLPLRVTHNDTKLNNILFDAETQAPLCVIDLDTIMPGFSAFDFGDSIRFGANTAAEDEKDLSKVQLDLSLFECYTRGYLKGCNGALDREEIALLPVGAILMTLECGVRFLTDYLEGDTYFKIHRPEHNLDRCRTQFRLVAEMEKHREEMDAIMERYQNA